jgi:hypothetical protein
VKVNFKTIIKRTVKIGGGILVVLIVLLFVLKFTIQIPAIQNKIKNQLTTLLSEKLNAQVSIDNFYLKLPKELAVKNILITRNSPDTLFYLEEFLVTIKFGALLKHKIDIQSITLKNSYGNLDKLLEANQPAQAQESNRKEVADTTAAPWDIIINQLSINNCYYKYRIDNDTGYELILDIGTMNIDLGYINPDSIFSIKNLDASETTIGYKSLTTPEMVLVDTAAFKMANILIENGNLENVKINYCDSVGGMLVFIDGDKVDAKNVLVDVWHTRIFFDSGTADGTVAMEFIPEQVDAPLQLWGIAFNDAKSDNLSFNLDFSDQPDTSELFDFYHIHLFDISGEVSDFLMNMHALKVHSNNFKLKEKCGLNITRFEADINQKDSVFSVDKLNIKTENGDYNLQLFTTAHPLFFDTGEKKFDVNIDVNTKNLYDIERIYNIGEIEYLSDKATNSKLKFTTKLNGTPNRLNIENFKFQLLDSIRVIADGTITDIQDSSKTKAHINLHKLLVSKNNLNQITDSLPTDSLISFPGFLLAGGVIKSTPKSYAFNGRVKSGIGSFTLNNIEASIGKNPEYKFDLAAVTNNLKSITDVGLNSIAFGLKGNFSGDNLQEYNAQFVFTIDSLNFKNENFRGITFNGELDAGKLNAQLHSNDKRLLFNLLTTGTLSEEQKKLDINLKASHFDIASLALVPNAKSVSGEANATIDFKSLHKFNFTTKLTDVHFYYTDSTIKIPDSKFIIINSTDKSSIEMLSQYNNISFEMDEDLMEIPTFFNNLRHHYLTDSVPRNSTRLFPSFQLKSEIDYDDIFTKMMTKGLPPFNKINIEGNYSDTAKKGFLSLDISGINSFDTYIDNTTIDINLDPESIDFNLALAKINNSIISGELYFSGNFKESTLLSELSFNDSQSVRYFNLKTKLKQTDDKTTVNIEPDSLIFKYDFWNIDPENQIIILPETVIFNRFDLSSGNQKINIASTESGKNCFIKIRNFSFESLDKLLNIDSLLNGIANADIEINRQNQFTVNGNLAVSNFYVYDIEMGDLSIPNFTYNSNGFKMNLLAKSNYIDISGQGNYQTNSPKSAVNFDIQINQLDLNELNYLLSDYSYDLEGTINGNINVTGNSENPEINGTLDFEKAAVGIKAFNNRFTLGNQSISIIDNILHLNNFQIVNNDNNAANINGTIAFDSTMNIQPNLKIHSDNMVLMNSTQDDNSMVFGLLKAQADLSLTSDNNKLLLDSEMKIDGKTDVTYIIPEQLALNNSNGTVKFTTFANDSASVQSLLDSAKFQHNELFEKIHSSINIQNGTKIKIYFDSDGKDFLEASINGILDYFSTEEDNNVSGRVDIVTGNLHYSIPMVKVKDFDIEPDSYIKISEKVTTPYLNLITSSSVRASTDGLMPDYDKVLKFKVLLKLEGDLDDLKMNFDISTVTTDAIVSSRLAQLSEKERNINALNLLIRGSFLLNTKGNSLVGSTDMADAQVDRFLANQLNQIISDNIHFVDLKFDVQSYFDINASSQYVFHRDYYFNVGKSLFNNRARINYKGSIGAWEEVESIQANSQFVQNELELEVKITKDGTYRGVFFMKNKYEGLLEGEVVETGGGIRIKKKYNSIKEIFTPKKRRKEAAENKDNDK